MDVLKLIGRSAPLFNKDLLELREGMADLVSISRFLVIGGAGSIGQAVTREIFKRGPVALHVVDISENNLVELVRDLRSTLGYIDGDFRTFALDCGSEEYRALISASDDYDYVLNLSALKHVRSERDPYTLMRLIRVNILNTIETIQIARNHGVRKYFCVSTDKAANPVNMMGASKRIMEMFLMRESESMDISTARFANVAFSDGSLLHGFNQRFSKRQPISAPDDVRRYFLTPQESGELCLMSCLLGENRDIYFPKVSDGQLHLTTFAEIAQRYIRHKGFEPYLCASEQEARERANELIESKRWPCCFFTSDTTGEKGFEEFFTGDEVLDESRFHGVGVVKNQLLFDGAELTEFLRDIENLIAQGNWKKTVIVDLFERLIPNFQHVELNQYLDGKM